jgi:hypothetical protein
MERFLYRLSQSQHAERFILKGALMLRAWRSPELRPTMDIDMLGRTRQAGWVKERQRRTQQTRPILAMLGYAAHLSPHGGTQPAIKT